MQKKEYTYSLYIPLYTDESIETSYDADDSTLRDILDSEIDETYDDLFENLSGKIDKILDDHLNEILDKFNMSEFETQLEDEDKVEDSIYYSIWTDILLSEYQIKELTKLFQEWLNVDSEARYDDVEFEGDFIGYEHGWNLPDSGGPPMYSDEKADIIISSSVRTDGIEITYDGEDEVNEDFDNSSSDEERKKDKVNTDAGDVEKNVAMFNHACDTNATATETIAESSTSRIYQHITDDDNWAIISPYRSEYSEDINRKRMTKLKAMMRDKGYGFIQFISRWVEDGEGFDEQSLLVPDITTKEAIKAGQDFQQSSVIVKDENGCNEICTNAFETYMPGDVVRKFNISNDHVMNISDAEEIFAKRRGGPASKPMKGGKAFHLSEVYEVDSPRASYFQNTARCRKIYSRN